MWITLVVIYFLSKPHHINGCGGMSVAFMPVGVIRQNTLNAAISNQKNCIKIRHTSNAIGRFKQVLPTNWNYQQISC